MAIIQSIFTICALVMVSVASAADTIVPEKRLFFWCTNHYKCPANSYRIPHRLCYDAFDDCACNHGFYKSKWEAKCIPFHPTSPPCSNDFHCPVNSYRTPNRDCYDSFDDCTCNHGFFKPVTGEVTCLPVCKNDFHCPVNSYRTPNRDCYDSFDDCTCNHGFFKPTTGEVTCLPIIQPTPAPTKPPTRAPLKPPTRAPRVPPVRAPVKPPVRAPVKAPVRAPVKAPVRAPVKPPTRNCNYICPRNSYRKPNRKCYSSFNDCECNHGFYRNQTKKVCIKKH